MYKNNKRKLNYLYNFNNKYEKNKKNILNKKTDN